MIHEALIKAEVAKRYYSEKGIELENEPARKKFLQDRHVDLQLLNKVIREIFKEQLTLIK